MNTAVHATTLKLILLVHPPSTVSSVKVAHYNIAFSDIVIFFSVSGLIVIKETLQAVKYHTDYQSCTVMSF
jgi:hypothetical protein